MYHLYSRRSEYKMEKSMSMQRRDFLKTLGTITVAGGLAGCAESSTSNEQSSLDKIFSFADNKVPMNAANLCPMPSAISKAIAKYNDELDVDMSGPNRTRIMALKNQARNDIAMQIGVSGDEVAIVRNTSEANNIVVQGISLNNQDEVLLWDQNHPSNKVAWKVRASRMNCHLRHISIPPDTNSIDEVVEIFVNAIGKKTKVVSFTHISNITGFRLPAKEICRAIKKINNDIHIHVDGAQTWGVVDVNLLDMGCDSFSGSAHKWYMGPREVGLLVVKKHNQHKIWPGVVSVPWGNEAEASVVGARKYEALGQRDDSAIAALAETVKFHNQITTAGIDKQAKSIANQLRQKLIDIDVPFVSPHNSNFTSNVIILSAPQETRMELINNILNDAGIILAPPGGFRLSPHIYNTPDHVNRVVDAVNKHRNFLG